MWSSFLCMLDVRAYTSKICDFNLFYHAFLRFISIPCFASNRICVIGVLLSFYTCFIIFPFVLFYAIFLVFLFALDFVNNVPICIRLLKRLLLAKNTAIQGQKLKPVFYEFKINSPFLFTLENKQGNAAAKKCKNNIVNAFYSTHCKFVNIKEFYREYENDYLLI